ncbi:hypothetical protein PENSPDRAFT_683482 [Peniophora sp. CONT]|nr:hypothetical protein PENSPDRAFT_683482 [Peniophora sp. CONT]
MPVDATAAALSSFKLERDAHSVRVENVPIGVCGRDVVELFGSLVGNIKTAEINDNERTVCLTFHSQDFVAKALCMTGYTIKGAPITVTGMNTAPPFRPPPPEKRNDTRRNLYVLGLPFDLTKAELTSIFSCHGSVNHCVILATVDNASRRRGFVVMSTHAQARAAMDAISRTHIRGSVVDVSWAVVQRSQGFLDGGDRTVALDSPTEHSPPAPAMEFSSNQATNLRAPSRVFSDITNASPPDFHNVLSHTLQLRSTLLISNLPNLLFSQDCDLEPLLYPYGKVKKIERQPTGQNGLYSAVVIYESPNDAQEARYALHGQVYGNHALVVEILDNPTHDMQPPLRPSSSTSSGYLNPYASPFVYGFPQVPGSAPPTCTSFSSDGDYFTPRTGSSSFLTPGADYAAPVPSHYRSLPSSNGPSRASSAASWESFESMPVDATPRDRRPALQRHLTSDATIPRWY